MAGEEKLTLSQSELASLIADGVAAGVAKVLDGHRSANERLVEGAEEARVASVIALNEACAEEEAKVRKSSEFKQHPDIGKTALLFGWTYTQFVEAIANRGQTRLAAA